MNTWLQWVFLGLILGRQTHSGKIVLGFLPTFEQFWFSISIMTQKWPETSESEARGAVLKRLKKKLPYLRPGEELREN